jgi:uncharacterized protein (DUF305 family)
MEHQGMADTLTWLLERDALRVAQKVNAETIAAQQAEIRRLEGVVVAWERWGAKVTVAMDEYLKARP